jgi:hypothetical protein
MSQVIDAAPTVPVADASSPLSTFRNLLHNKWVVMLTVLLLVGLVVIGWRVWSSARRAHPNVQAPTVTHADVQDAIATQQAYLQSAKRRAVAVDAAEASPESAPAAAAAVEAAPSKEEDKPAASEKAEDKPAAAAAAAAEAEPDKAEDKTPAAPIEAEKPEPEPVAPKEPESEPVVANRDAEEMISLVTPAVVATRRPKPAEHVAARSKRPVQ